MYSLSCDYLHNFQTKVSWMCRLVNLVGGDMIFYFLLLICYNIPVWMCGCYRDLNLLSFLCFQKAAWDMWCDLLLKPALMLQLKKKDLNTTHDSLWYWHPGRWHLSSQRRWAHSRLVLKRLIWEIPHQGLLLHSRRWLASVWLNLRPGNCLPISFPYIKNS